MMIQWFLLIASNLPTQNGLASYSGKNSFISAILVEEIFDVVELEFDKLLTVDGDSRTGDK